MGVITAVRSMGPRHFMCLMRERTIEVEITDTVSFDKEGVRLMADIAHNHLAKPNAAFGAHRRRSWRRTDTGQPLQTEISLRADPAGAKALSRAAGVLKFADVPKHRMRNDKGTSSAAWLGLTKWLIIDREW